jgi:SNF family Na+-dependent transporter
VQSIHILAIAAVLSSVAMVELRIMGVTRSQTMAETAHRFMPWIWLGLLVLALSGTVLIIGEPKRTLDNNVAFYFKLAMIAVAITVTIAFQASLRRNLTFWESGERRWWLSALALVTIVLWLAIAVAGRWIAYVRVD